MLPGQYAEEHFAVICDLGLSSLRTDLTDTVAELHEWESRASGFKEDRETLRRQLEEQAGLIVRLRGALEEYDRVVSTDAQCVSTWDQFQRAIRLGREALSPTEPKEV